MSLCFVLLIVAFHACQVDTQSRDWNETRKQVDYTNIICGLCLGLYSFPIYFPSCNKFNVVIPHSPAGSGLTPLVSGPASGITWTLGRNAESQLPLPQLLDQNLHFNKIPTSTFYFCTGHYSRRTPLCIVPLRHFSGPPEKRPAPSEGLDASVPGEGPFSCFPQFFLLNVWDRIWQCGQCCPWWNQISGHRSAHCLEQFLPPHPVNFPGSWGGGWRVEGRERGGMQISGTCLLGLVIMRAAESCLPGSSQWLTFFSFFLCVINIWRQLFCQVSVWVVCVSGVCVCIDLL